MSTDDPIRWITLRESDQPRLRAAVARSLASRSWVQAAYLYGSAARGQPARDLDLGLVAEPVPADWSDVATIANEIAADLEVPATDLDVRILNGGDPVFLGNVMRDGKLLFERDLDARVRFEVYALNQWLDFRPAWERARSRVLAQWSDG